MRVTVVGCAGSYAGPTSPASSYLVRAEHGGRTVSIVIDLGNGAFGALQRHVDPNDVDAVLLTHLHPDHCADLTGFYVHRRYAPHDAPEGRLTVWGPSGTAERLDLMYHGLEDGGMGAVFDVRGVESGVGIVIGPMTITPHLVEHPVEAYGYRVEVDGAVVALTGDTDACEALTPLLTGADLALVDSAFVDGRDTERGIHLSGRRAAEAAVAAGGVRRLVLTHIPAWNDREVCRAQAAAVWPGMVELAEPDTTYQL